MEPSLSDGTPVDLPSLFRESSVDLPMEIEPSHFGESSVDLPLPPFLSGDTEEALPSSPCYSSCEGSSDELIKYLGIPAPTTAEYFRVRIINNDSC